MEMPDRVVINSDNTLSIFVDSQEYTFNDNQYLKSDKGLILLKHNAVCLLAELTGVKVDVPVLLSNINPVIYVFARTARRGEESHTAVGESNKLNLFCDIMLKTPATTADNRAYERAVLGVLGLHGSIYGASEMNYKDREEPSEKNKKTSKKQSDEPKEKPSENEKTDEEKTNTDGKPFWWEETGKGVYTDKVLNPETFIITEGPCKGKNWTTKQLYDYQYKSCLFFAERANLNNSTEDFKKQVYSCRRAIREYGLKE